jgi:hypothetical protein
VAGPVYQAAGTTALFTSTTTVRAQYPTLQANDILFWIAIASSSASGMTITWPAGWTSILEGENTDDCHCYVAWRRADGSETGNVDATISATNSGCTTIVSFRGAHKTGTPWEGYSFGFGTSTNVDAPAVTSTDIDRLAVHLILPRSNVATTETSPWTEHVDSGGNVARNVVESAPMATPATLPLTTRVFGTARDYFTIGLALIPAVVTPQGDGDSEGELATATLLSTLVDPEGDGDSDGELATATLLSSLVDPEGDGDSEGEVASAVLLPSLVDSPLGDGDSEGELAAVAFHLPVEPQADGDSEGELASVALQYSPPSSPTRIGEAPLLVRIATPARNVTMSSSTPPVIQ